MPTARALLPAAALLALLACIAHAKPVVYG
jgi:hypothetical protein